MLEEAILETEVGEENFGEHPGQRFKKETIIGGLGITLLIIGLISALILASRQSSKVEIIPAQEIESQQNKEIIVDVAGAVQNPGIYRLKSGSRINDALMVSGGLSADADREWVAKNVNLAAPLKDAIKIYIKSIKDIKNITSIGQSQVLSGVTEESKININTASLAELDRLPGIGPVTGQRILDYRDKNGSFDNIEDLLKVAGIGQKLFDKIKDRITVW